MFRAGSSYCEALPRLAGSLPNPYTAVHPNARVRERQAETARHRSGGSGSRWRAAACPARRVMSAPGAMPRPSGSLVLRQGMRLPAIASFWSADLEDSVSRCTSRRAASRRIWETGSRAGTWAVRVMGCHLREGRAAGQELPGRGSVPAPWTVCPARITPRRRQVRYAVGQRHQGLPPQSAQSTQRLACRRQAGRLADRRASRSIADTQVSPRCSIREDTSDSTVCQGKDFTILSSLQGSVISMGVSCLCENADQ